MSDDDHPAHNTPFIPDEITLLVEHKTTPTRDNLGAWLANIAAHIADKTKIEFDLPVDPFSTMIPVTLLPVQQTLDKLALVAGAVAAEQAEPPTPANQAPQSLIHLKIK